MGHVGSVSIDAKRTPIGFKWCPVCATEKKLDEFYLVKKKRAGRVIEVPEQMCKPCKADKNSRRKR